MITECAPIRGFEGQYRFLSNFYPCKVSYCFVTYPTVEHAYQAAKTFDNDERTQIRQAKSPAAAKRIGKRVTMRPDWEEIKFFVMFDLVKQKFSKEPFRTWLVKTGDSYIEETNWWHDTYWGVCNGTGQNKLGVILMNIRDSLK